MKKATLLEKMRDAFFYIFLLSVYCLVALIPSDVVWHAFILPEFVAALSCAWVLRSPQTLPFYLIGAGALSLDLILSRPLGLWALLTLIATNIWRKYASAILDLPRIFEIIFFGVTIFIMQLLQRLIFKLSFLQVFDLKYELYYFIGNFLSYIVIVTVILRIFGIKRSRNLLAE